MNDGATSGGARTLTALLVLDFCLLNCSSEHGDPTDFAGAAGAASLAGGEHHSGEAGSAGAALGGSSGSFETLAGASGDAGSAADGAAGSAAAGQPSTLATFVWSRQELPTAASSFAIDLDGNGSPDNAYARLRTVLDSYGFALQQRADEDSAAGLGLQLWSVELPDPLAPSSAFAVDWLRAAPTPNPLFDGSGSFVVDAAVARASIPGTLTGAAFTSSPLTLGSKPEQVLLRLPFGTAVDLPVRVVSLEFTTLADGSIAGQLNGAILATEVDRAVPAAVAARLNAVCGAVPAQCAPYLLAFDKNHDGGIGEDEVRSVSAVKSLLAPDVKLFDEHGGFAPDASASQKDSLSVGVAFVARGAHLAP